MARGFLPVTTRSVRRLAHSEFASAVEGYQQRETEAISGYVEELTTHSPFNPDNPLGHEPTVGASLLAKNFASKLAPTIEEAS